MRVKELIKELSFKNPELEVVTGYIKDEDGDEGYCTLDYLEEVEMGDGSLVINVPDFN